MGTVFAERPRFFEGQYLGADDLEAFLTYAREHDARHLLGAHTWGVVSGIELASGTSPGGDIEYFLTPGIAIDGYGRLIVVTAPYRLTSDLFAPHPSGRVNVWIRHEEAPFSGMRAGFQVCDCSDSFARVQESFVVETGPRTNVTLRESGVVVGDETFTDAREALGFSLPKQPIACDASVAAQSFPAEDAQTLWLIAVCQVPWNQASGEFVAATETDQKMSRIFRRQAGVVTDHIYPAGGVIRLRPRWSARQVGVTTDQICSTNAIKEADLVTCGGDLTFREMIWLEGNSRFKGDARLYGTRLEFQESAGTDYLANGVPLAIRRRPDRNEHEGFDLQVLLGQRQGTDGPTRLTIGQAVVQGTDPCALDFDFTPGVYIQEDAKVGIGTTDSLLALPLTIRATGANGDLVGFEAADGSIDWQINFGPNTNGLNFTETDPEETHLFLETGGNVGIGTLDPEAKLDIRSVPAPSGNALGANKWLQAGDGDDTGRFWIQYGDQLAPLMVLSDMDDPPRIQFQQIGNAQETGPQFFSWIGHARGESSDLAVMNGRLGVGTVNPFVALTVDGSLGFKSGGDPMIYIHEAGTGNPDRMVIAHSPDFPDWGLSYRDSDDTFLFLNSGTAEVAVDLQNGRLGIGTTNPTERLDVRGDIKLGAAGDFFGVGCLNNFRMVAGRVSGTGGVLSGSGFSANQVSDGEYTVSFSVPFTATPVIVVTLVDPPNEDNFVCVMNASQSQFTVASRDYVEGEDNPEPQDSAFNFIALGQRA
jgi:hypothetical protein